MTIGDVVRRTVTVVVLAGALAVVDARIARAQDDGSCIVRVSGEPFDVRDADDPDDAITITGDDTLVLRRPADGALGALVWFGPAPVPLPSVGDEGTEVEVDVGDVDWLAVGLYRVELFGPGAGDCAGTFWVRVEGPLPFATVAGATALAVAVGGAAAVASAVRRGRRARCSVRRGVIGGILLGIGGGALAQMLFVPMLLPVVVAVLLVPAVAGGLVARSACAPVPVAWTLAPVLLAPLVVRAGDEFDVQLGVEDATRHRRRGERAPSLTAQLVAGGAAVAEGESWRHALGAGAGQPGATTVVRMRASRDVGETYLTALYASGGQTVGIARRPLWVVPAGGALPPPAAEARTVGVPFAVPATGTGHPPERAIADLELRATVAGPRALHVTQWTVESRHRDRLRVPDDPVTVDLGAAPEEFLASLLLDVAESDGRAGIDELLLGAGRQLARAIDPSLVTLLRELLSIVAVPKVLLLVEDACVPWELLAVEPAPAGEPPFLATRAVVGRWFLDPGTATLPPPVDVATGRRTVIATAVLPAAELEARRLHAELGFERGEPTVAGFLDALERSATVHLACHGSWRSEQGRWFLELVDGRVVPRHVAGLRLAHHPFVVLNACQVGPGGEMLGTATGFPAELEFAGASGCVAPLWSVRDDEAARIGVEIELALVAGRAPAEVIRDLRRDAMVDGVPSATAFAYQYVGHPGLHVGGR